jgi:hypothetical protein
MVRDIFLILDAGLRRFNSPLTRGARVLCCVMLDIGCWMFDIGYGMRDMGYEVLDIGWEIR